MQLDLLKILVDHLKTMPHVEDLEVVQLTIGEGKKLELFCGVRYTLIVNQESESEYKVTRFEMVGPLPKCKQGKKNVCFTFQGEDWYVATWYESDIPNKYNVCRTFTLHKWDVADNTKIDTYERKPYIRIPMSAVLL